jgi:hypothetical protein
MAQELMEFSLTVYDVFVANITFTIGTAGDEQTNINVLINRTLQWWQRWDHELRHDLEYEPERDRK